MRFFPGQRIGQSGNELVLSVFFSFFLHAALIVLALVFYTAMAPKVYLPPFYEVKLVGQPAESAPAPAPAAAPPLAKPEPAPPQPKVKIAAPKPASKPLNKSAMPELAAQKTKPSQKAAAKAAKTEQVKPAAAEQAKPAPKELASAPNAPAAAPAKAGGEAGVGVVKASSQNPKLEVYARQMREIIGNNWSPPIGAKGIKATVLFKVLRSGRIVEVKIEESSKSDPFDMAARRAILDVKSFPPMPDDFYKDSENFSIDLLPQE